MIYVLKYYESEHNFKIFLTFILIFFTPQTTRKKNRFYIGNFNYCIYLYIKLVNLIVRNIMNIKIRLEGIEIEKNFFKRKLTNES